MKIRAITAVLAVAGSIGIATISAPPAQAAQCAWYPGTNSANSTGTFSYKYNGYNLYSGPSTSCAKLGYVVPAGTKVHLRCVEFTGTATWYYIDYIVRGWVSGANFGPMSGITTVC